MNAKTRIPALALTAALTLTLTACSNDTNAPTGTPAAATPVAVATATPGATEPAPAEPTSEATEAPAPEADEYSAVIDGVLYQGTASAPVRIGNDTPGKAPAADTGKVPRTELEDTAIAADKYVVYVGRGDAGFIWKVFGMSRFGSFRELSHGGLSGGVGETAVSKPYATVGAALDAPKVVNGRELDRAEYILLKTA